METLEDLFTGGYDTGLWNVSKTNANTTVTGVGNQMEVVNTDSVGGYDGLTTKIAYDLTAVALANILPTRLDSRFEFWLSPADLQNTDPTTAADYIRLYISGGDVRIAQRISSGTPTDVYVVGSGTGEVFELNMPSTGDEVRAIINAIERKTLASFGFSRTCYIAVLAYTDTSAQEVHFDTFNATYQASGPAISAVDATARRGQTDFNFTITGGDAVAGLLDINGSNCPITVYNANGVCTATIPTPIAELYDAVAVVTFTDFASGTPTGVTDLLPAATDDFVVSAGTLDLTTASIYYGYTGQVPRVGQDITHTILTSISSKTFNVNADGTWSLSGAVTVSETVQIFVTDTDGSVGSIQTFTLSPDGTGSFGANIHNIGIRRYRKRTRRK